MVFYRVVWRFVQFLAVACLVVAVGISPLSARQWTDNSGKYHVEAEFVGLAGETVHLRKPDGKVIAVVLARLNDEGRQAVAAAARAVAERSNESVGAERLQTAEKTAATEAHATPPQNGPLPLNLNSPWLAKAIAAQQEVLLAKMNVRVAQASDLWNVTEKFFDAQLAAVAKWKASGQTSALSIGPDEALRTMAKGLAAHRPRAIWDALPLTYQQDLRGLLHDHAAQTDPELWRAGRQVLQKSLLVLRTQQKFLLNYSLIHEVLEESRAAEKSPGAVTSAEQTAENEIAAWEATVNVCELFAKSDLADLSKLRTLDLGQFLDQTGVELMQQLGVASRLAGDDSFNHTLSMIAGMQVTLVNTVGTEAVIRLTSGELSELNTMVLVEGKWIPAELAAAWPGWMSNVREGLKTLQGEAFAEAKPQWIGQLQNAEQVLDRLLLAQSQLEFDTLLNGLLVTEGEQ